MTGWDYRQMIIVSSSTGAGTGYQVEVDVTMSFLNNHANSDFGDVRFTASDGTTLLTYYIKSFVSGISANFLVKVTDDLSSVNALIYIYYGNASATTTSSTSVYDAYIDGTTDQRSSFVLRHIFTPTHTNSLTWDSTNHFFGLQLASAADGEFAEIQGLSGNNFEVKGDWAHTHNALDVRFGIGGRYTSSGVYLLRDSVGDNNFALTKEDNPPSAPATISSSARVLKSDNIFYTFIGRIYGTTLHAEASTGESLTNSDTAYSSGTFGLMIYNQFNGGIQFKNIVVRHYVSPEPTVYMIGPETPIAPILIDPTDGRTIP